MTRLLKDMPDFANVGAGQKPIANLPVGLTYDFLAVGYQANGSDANEATMKADLTSVKLIIDGDVKIDSNATELLDLFQYYGGVVEDGVLPILFSRPWMRSIGGEDVLAYGTQDVSTMSLEIEIDGSATTPALDLSAEQSAPKPLGQHMTLRRYGRNASATGILEEANLPRGNYGLAALHATTGNVGEVEIEANNRIVHESDLKRRRFRDSLRGKTHQSGYTHINFLTDDRLSSVLPMNVQDFRVRFDMTSTGTFAILQERIETFKPGQ